MAKQNLYIAAPRPPGYWVDYESCICGAEYSEYRVFPKGKSGKRFSEGASRIRIAAGGFESGGGWRSRRSVLWVLRVIKLSSWFEEHVGCEGLAIEHVDTPPHLVRIDI